MSDDGSTLPDPDGGRPAQHGPEMDDDQVDATGELRDELPPVDAERDVDLDDED